MKEEHRWGWPVASYLFLGGLGGGMIALAGLSDLIFGRGEAFSLGSLIAGIAIAVGSALLIFELGRPFQFWRVLSRQKAIMTAGAWMLSFTIFTSFAYFSFWPDFSPWRELVGLRHLVAGINIVLGLGVCIYTGILLGSLRARAFWNTPILPVLFLVSGLSTGAAAQSLLAGAWPYRGSAADVEAVHAALRSLDLDPYRLRAHGPLPLCAHDASGSREGYGPHCRNMAGRSEKLCLLGWSCRPRSGGAGSALRGPFRGGPPCSAGPHAHRGAGPALPGRIFR